MNEARRLLGEAEKIARIGGHLSLYNEISKYLSEPESNAPSERDRLAREIYLRMVEKQEWRYVGAAAEMAYKAADAFLKEGEKSE